MNFSTAVFIINKDARAIVTEYDPENQRDKRVLYKTLDPNIHKGDYVVVPTATRHGFTVVKVVDEDVPVNFDAPEEIKWIVQKVNRGDFDRLVKDEGEAIRKLQIAEQRKRAQDMKNLMFGDHATDLHALPLYKNGDTPAAPPTNDPDGPAF